MSWRFISPLKITTQDTDGVDSAILSLSRQTTAKLMHSRMAAPEQSSPPKTSYSSPKVHFISLGKKIRSPIFQTVEVKQESMYGRTFKALLD